MCLGYRVLFETSVIQYMLSGLCVLVLIMHSVFTQFFFNVMEERYFFVAVA